MMLPILIWVSVAPVSYFFWASAVPLMAAKAMTAVVNAAIRGFLKSIVSPEFFQVSVSFEFADQLLRNNGDLPCAVRHKEDDEKQKHAEHRAGEALRDSLRDVRHEDDEGRAHDRSGQPSHAADPHAEEQRDRQRDGVAVGRHELNGDGAEAAGDAGDSRADAECQRLVQRDVDAPGGGG